MFLYFSWLKEPQRRGSCVHYSACLVLAVVTTYCFDLPSDKEESKINMLLPLKSLRNVYSSEYIKGLEIVCNMIINKAAEV